MEIVRTEPFQNCIFCGVTGKKFYEGLRDFRGIVRGEFDLRYCAYCNLLWLDPRPIAEDIKKCYYNFFPEEIKHDNSKSNLFTLFKDSIRKSILCGYFGYRHIHKKHILCKIGTLLGKIPILRSKATYDLGELFLPHSKQKKDSLIIDIGCGRGDYLELMQQLGWNVLGIEPDPVAVSIVKKKGISVFKGTLEEAKLNDSIATQITMRHSIEHLPDPQSAVKECYRILKEGGRLVAHTPNAGSLGHRVFKRHCSILDMPRHLFLFFPESIRKIFQKSQFKHFYIRTLPSLAQNVYYNSTFISKREKLGQEKKVPLMGYYLFMLKELLLCYVGKEYGEEIEIVAIK